MVTEQASQSKLTYPLALAGLKVVRVRYFYGSLSNMPHKHSNADATTCKSIEADCVNVIPGFYPLNSAVSLSCPKL